MHTVIATRFNNQTYQQNLNYRNRHSMKGCIYGIPRELNSNIYGSHPIFVIEMNITENEIMGVGLVQNKPYFDKRYNIYDNGNYNRYIFKSEYRIDRSELMEDNEGKIFIYVLEEILFNISKCYKKGQGFTRLPSWMRNTKSYNYNSVLINLFKKKYCNKKNINTSKTL